MIEFNVFIPSGLSFNSPSTSNFSRFTRAKGIRNRNFLSITRGRRRSGIRGRIWEGKKRGRVYRKIWNGEINLSSSSSGWLPRGRSNLWTEIEEIMSSLARNEFSWARATNGEGNLVIHGCCCGNGWMAFPLIIPWCFLFSGWVLWTAGKIHWLVSRSS